MSELLEPSEPGLRLCLKVISAASFIVPRQSRPDWRMEWEAEVRHRWEMLVRWNRLTPLAQSTLFAACVGAFRDATVFRMILLWENIVLRDLRHAARSLARSRGFALLTVLTAALGIGLNTTVFTVADSLLWRPLPYREPERLVFLHSVERRTGDEYSHVSFPDYVDRRNRSRSFEEVGAYDVKSVAFFDGGAPAWVSGAEISASLFPTLGVSPVLGRPFSPDEDRSGGGRAALIGHGLWQRRFGGDPGAVGRSVVIDGVPVAVVGVMPPGFQFPEDAELWLPLARDPLTEGRDARTCRIVARLKPGVRIEQAQAESDAAHVSGSNGGKLDLATLVRPIREVYARDGRPVALLFFGGGVFVLLIACANVAGLMLTRGVSRRNEVVLRSVLGAGRGRILRFLLLESILLSSLAGFVGGFFGWIGKTLLTASLPQEPPFWMKFDFNPHVFAFIVGVSILTGIVSGLFPALHLSKANLVEQVKECSQHLATNRSQGRFRTFLIVTETALTLVLLVGAGLMLKGVVRLRNTNPGFVADHLLTMRTTLSVAEYPRSEDRRRFFGETIERINRLPGIERTAAISELPLSGDVWNAAFEAENKPPAPKGAEYTAVHRVVTPGCFETLGVKLIRGRDFDESDTSAAPPVAVVGRGLADRYWPGENPLGKRFRYAAPTGTWISVVGVVDDVRYGGLGRPVRDAIYRPFAQVSVTSLAFVVKSAAAPTTLIDAVREQIRAVDPDQPVYQIRPMEAVVAESFREFRFMSHVSAVFAGQALVLAAVGVFSVVSQVVALRRREIAVRVVLGARRGDVVGAILGQAMRPVGIGLLVGAALIWPSARLIASVQPDAPPFDLAVSAVAAMLVIGVAVAGCLIPARRAARTDPLPALRED